jgi:putative transposase
VIAMVEEQGARLGIAPTCAALGLARATFYRQRRRLAEGSIVPRVRRAPRQALAPMEREAVLALLHDERFVDLPPAQVWAQLLDAGRVPPCSIRTMYRVLAANQEVRERRNQLRHPVYQKPELLATGPNQVWSWDITKLLGPVKWTYFYLYVLLDIFSRYVVGWLLARQESAALAKVLIQESCQRQAIDAGELIIHADRGPSMTSQPVALLLATLGVLPSHSRPHVSDDNPFSEAQFKTLKYRPDFPARFGSLEDSEGFCQRFFPWYNTEHRHVALGLMTPYDMHYGLAQAKWEQRAAVLRAAYAAHPERFPHGIPLPPPLPTAAWINKPLGLDIAPKAPTAQVADAVAFSPAGITAPDGGGS